MYCTHAPSGRAGASEILLGAVAPRSDWMVVHCDINGCVCVI